jgi:hypothetical protein
MIDGSRDIADIVDVVFRGMSATTAARIPAQFIRAIYPGYSRAVKVGNDEAVLLGDLIRLQSFLRRSPFNPRGVAEPTVQDDSERPYASCRHVRRRIDPADPGPCNSPWHRPSKTLLRCIGVH